MSSGTFSHLHSAGRPDVDSTPAEVFYAHLSAVYAVAASNQHVFASPLGPLPFHEQYAWLPRFVFFGPGATNECWRLGLFAGFDHRDLRASHALLGFVQHLASRADDGHGLNLSLFPLVDLGGHLFAESRQLATAHWGRSEAPEIRMLERHVRDTAYHGFIRVETATGTDDHVRLSLASAGLVDDGWDVELVVSADFHPYSVDFERGDSGGRPATSGPLTVAEDLPVQPFEVTLRVPSSWTNELYQSAVNTILGSFLLRYRAFQAFGQHL